VIESVIERLYLPISPVFKVIGNREELAVDAIDFGRIRSELKTLLLELGSREEHVPQCPMTGDAKNCYSTNNE